MALSWEFGVDQEPWIHLEDDYGYQFDNSEQVALMRARMEDRYKRQVAVRCASQAK